MTLLFDEIDATFGPKARDKEDLRALVNAGYRRGARAYRCVGEGARQRVEAFPVFGAKALAGIGELPETIADRSIPIRLRRRSREEVVERGRFRTITVATAPLHEAAVSWANDASEKLRGTDPKLPEELDDRAQDGAEPLLAVADLCGGDWPERARAALLTVFAAKEVDDLRMESDCSPTYDAFRDIDRLATAELLDHLTAEDEAPGLNGVEAPDSARARCPGCLSHMGFNRAASGWSPGRLRRATSASSSRTCGRDISHLLPSLSGLKTPHPPQRL